MIVVADTTPLNYLILIGVVDVLGVLFGEVVIPKAVAVELCHDKSPSTVKDWCSTLPPWCRVMSGPSIEPDGRLGHGEREAIGLASELKADLLLMDDRVARRRAEDCGHRVVGAVSILEVAGDRKLLDFVDCIERLKATTFHVSNDILAEAVRRCKKRNDC